jgi:hypothetical protein
MKAVMKMLRVGTFIVGLCLLGKLCAAAEQPKSIPSSLSGIKYDTTGKVSEPYAIFVKTYRDQLYLVYRGPNNRETNLIFVKKSALEAIAAIDKFMEWERLAVSRKETLSKKISGVPSLAGIYLYFGFKSLDVGRHVLEMGIRSKMLGDSSGAAAGIVDAMVDRDNAVKLRELLVRFSKGEALDKEGDVYR